MRARRPSLTETRSGLGSLPTRKRRGASTWWEEEEEEEEAGELGVRTVPEEREGRCTKTGWYLL